MVERLRNVNEEKEWFTEMHVYANVLCVLDSIYSTDLQVLPSFHKISTTYVQIMYV